MPECCVCNTKVHVDDRVVCDICNAAMHGTCAGLSHPETSCVKNVNRRLHFFCKRCNLIDIVNELKSEIVALKMELEEMKNVPENSGEALAGSITSDGHRALSDEQLFAEIEERQLRARNIIITNVPEPQGSSAEEKNKEDFNAVRYLIGTTNVINYNVIHCSRVGRNSRNKPRPIRLRLLSELEARIIMQRFVPVDNIFMNKDLTPMQQNSAHLIREEFRARVNAGETNVKCNYHNGMPKIVKIARKKKHD